MKFNILYLSETARFSGAEESLLNLVRFRRREEFAAYFVLPEDGPFVDKLRKENVQVFISSMPKIRHVRGAIHAARAILSIVEANNIDLLHTNSIRTHIYGVYAAKKMGIPIFWHERNLITNEIFDPDRIFSFLPDKIICNSSAIADRFKKNGRIPAKVEVIYNGVDTANFHPSSNGSKIRGEFGIGPDEIVIGIASRFNVSKGHEVFLSAAKILLHDTPGIRNKLRFLIAGGSVFDEDAPTSKYLIELANSLAISDSIIFAGFREDMPEIYAAIDIFVLASNAEPCGRVLIEAMASGKVMVATNSGGTPEIVKDGETGFLVEPGDPEALADKIALLAVDKDLAGRMGRAGRRRVEENFSIKKNVSEIQKIYIEVLESRQRSQSARNGDAGC